MAEPAFAFIAPAAPPAPPAAPVAAAPEKLASNAPKFDEVLHRKDAPPEPKKLEAKPEKPEKPVNHKAKPQQEEASEEEAAAPEAPEAEVAEAAPEEAVAPAAETETTAETNTAPKALPGLDGLFAALAAPWQAFEQLMHFARGCGIGEQGNNGNAYGVTMQLTQRITVVTARIETFVADSGTPLGDIQEQLATMRDVMKLLTEVFSAGVKPAALEKPEFKPFFDALAALPDFEGGELALKLKEAVALLNNAGGFAALRASIKQQTTTTTTTTTAFLPKHGPFPEVSKPHAPKAPAPVEKPAAPVKPEAPQVTTDTDNAALAATVSSTGTGEGDNSANTEGGQENFNSLLPQGQTGQSSAPKAPDAPVFAKLVEAHAQSAPPADQLMAHVKMMTHRGDSRIQIQLHPAELGWLDIRLEVTGEGKANLNITAESSKTLEMLRSDARILERMLTDIGMKADAGSLSFNLRDERQPGNPYYKQDDTQYGSGPDTEDEVAAIAAATREYVVEETEGLDIRI